MSTTPSAQVIRRLPPVAVLLASLLAAIGCSSGGVPSQPAPGNAAAAPTSEEEQRAAEAWKIKPPRDGKPSFWVAAPAQDAPVVKLSAAEFGDELKASGEAILGKYAGKWLEITGKVDRISPRNREGESQLVMPGQDLKEGYQSYDIDTNKMLVFNMNEPALWKVTSPGATVTMRAVLARVVSGVAGFDHSTIVSTEKHPVPEIEAAEMASAWVRDREACKAAYHGKPFLARGVFERYEKDSKLPILKGEGEIGVVLYFFGSDPDFENLQPGDPLVVFGVCEVNTSDIGERKVILNSAFRIKE